MLSLNKYRILAHIITYIIIICFSCQNYVWAQGTPMSIQGTSSINLQNSREIMPLIKNSFPSVDDLSVPADFGMIKERQSGNNGKIVIHIQDSHANYEAQANHAKLLGHLTKMYFNDGKKLVAVEGASGPLTAVRFKTVPDQEVKKIVIDHYFKNALFNGAEYFSIFAADNVELYGIEEIALYKENLAVFRQAQETKPVVLACLKKLRTGLEGLIEKLFPEELTKLARVAVTYGKGEADFSVYLNMLLGYVETANLSLAEYPQIKFAVDSLELQNSLEMDKVAAQRQVVIQQLLDCMVTEEAQGLIKLSLQLRLGKVQAKCFYENLAGLITNYGLKNEDYPDLQKYMKLVELHAKVNPEELFAESERLEKDLKERLFNEKEQNELDRLITAFIVLEHLAGLKLSRKEQRQQSARPPMKPVEETTTVDGDAVIDAKVSPADED